MAEPPRKRTRRHLVLVRTPKEPVEQDPYRVALDSLAADGHSLRLHHLAVLETAFCNQDELIKTVATIHDPAAPETTPPYDGIVLTSARSVDAYCAAQTALAPSNPLPPPSVPFFVVGHPTCTALHRAPCAPRPEQVLGADEGGTGERLAEYIVRYFAAGEHSDAPRRGRKPRLLYLTGDKNRDTLPRILSAGGIDLEPLQVYSTCRCPEFEARLEAVLGEIRAEEAEPRGAQEEEDREGYEIWFALFSPSGAGECLAEMRQRGLLADSTASVSSSRAGPESPPARAPRHRIRFAAIGPVTERFLREQDLPVDAVASHPEPAALLSAVLSASEVASYPA